VFRLPAGDLPRHAGVDLGDEGFVIYELVKVATPTTEEIAQRREAFEQQLARAVAQQELAAYVEALKQRTKITRHPERIARGDTR
jgi:peptidyl-prolyl cis-trans isomerase D